MTRLAQFVRSVDVEVPRRTVYDQWTRVEQFPLFVPGVEEVRHLDARHVLWRAQGIGGAADWVAQIQEKVPDRRIQWRALGTGIQSGIVSFDPLSDLRTRVTVRFDYEPERFGARSADLVALLSRRVEDGLQSFKQHLEARGREAGGTSRTDLPREPQRTILPEPFGGTTAL
jgi:uncharacterized membrane protein